MKKYFTVFTILFSCFFLKAQEIKNEISIKIGYSSFGPLLQFFLNREVKNSDEKISLKTATPSIFINYKRSISKRWDINASIGYEKHIGKDAKPARKDLPISNLENSTKTTNSSIFNIIAGISMNYNYIKKEKFQLYSGIGISLLRCIIYEETNFNSRKNSETTKNEIKKTLPFPHLSLLGFRYGEKFGITSEIGFGYKGLINLGLSYRF